jgi:hypothetical protein
VANCRHREYATGYRHVARRPDGLGLDEEFGRIRGESGVMQQAWRQSRRIHGTRGTRYPTALVRRPLRPL